MLRIAEDLSRQPTALVFRNEGYVAAPKGAHITLGKCTLLPVYFVSDRGCTAIKSAKPLTRTHFELLG